MNLKMNLKTDFNLKKTTYYYELIKNAIEIALKKYKRANSSFWVISLCFYTILSLVPVIAILLSVGSLFGMKDVILNQFDTYSPLKKDVLNIIINFSDNLLENARGGVLAGVGFVFLAWTFVGMFSVIENALNDIWHVKKARSIIRKTSDYISFFIFIPLLLLILNGVFIYLANKLAYIPILYIVLTKGIPFFSLLAMLFIFYIFMPNTSVKIRPAFISALVIAIAFSCIQNFSIYLQTGINKYNYIYGSFSVIFIFLIWIRVTWFLIILGGHICYILQNPTDVLSDNYIEFSFNDKLLLSFSILKIMATKFKNNEPPVSLEELITTLSIPERNILKIIKIFAASNIVMSSDSFEDINTSTTFCIINDAEKIKLSEIYNIVASEGDGQFSYRDETLEALISERVYDKNLLEIGGE